MLIYRQVLWLIGMSVFICVVVSLYWALVTGSIFLCLVSILYIEKPKEIYMYSCSLDIHEVINLLDGENCTVSLIDSNKKVVIEIDEDVDLQLQDYYIRKN